MAGPPSTPIAAAPATFPAVSPELASMLCVSLQQQQQLLRLLPAGGVAPTVGPAAPGVIAPALEPLAPSQVGQSGLA